MTHDPGCSGGHTDEISCDAVATLRALTAADPWHCPESGRYHTFSSTETGTDATCGYGCGRTWSELEAEMPLER